MNFGTALCLTAGIWYATGALFFWATLVVIDPIIRRKDILPILLSGVIGPVAVVIFLITLSGRSGGSEKPVRWLSLTRR
jgi:hypothetical protein